MAIDDYRMNFGSDKFAITTNFHILLPTHQLFRFHLVSEQIVVPFPSSASEIFRFGEKDGGIGELCMRGYRFEETPHNPKPPHNMEQKDLIKKGKYPAKSHCARVAEHLTRHLLDLNKQISFTSVIYLEGQKTILQEDNDEV